MNELDEATLPANGSASRIDSHDSWIAKFVRHTSNLPSPELFRLWGGIAAVGAVAERRCWTTLRGMPPLYPNLFVLLVSPPGVGKSVVVNAVSHFWRATKRVHIAASTVTKAALIDTLKDARRDIPGLPGQSYHSLQIPATEFGNLVPAYDLPFINVLNDLFDCRDDFTERTRSLGEKVIARPQISILGGTQPDYLSVMLPEAAWGMGFTSRIIMIYSNDKEASRRSLFAFKRPSKTDHDDLTAALTAISRLHGEFQWTPEAAKLLDEWHIAGGPPIPNTPRLEHYVTRRTIHLVKLMSISALSRQTLTIARCDFECALEWLLQAEQTMPEIFRAMTMGPDAATLTDAAMWIGEREAILGRPLYKHTIIDFLRTRMKATDVIKNFELMIASNLIIQSAMDGRGQPLYSYVKSTPEVIKITPANMAPREPDLFKAPDSTPPESIVPARYILRVPDDERGEATPDYDADFYEAHQ